MFFVKCGLLVSVILKLIELGPVAELSLENLVRDLLQFSVVANQGLDDLS